MQVVRCDDLVTVAVQAANLCLLSMSPAKGWRNGDENEKEEKEK